MYRPRIRIEGSLSWRQWQPSGRKSFRFGVLPLVSHALTNRYSRREFLVAEVGEGRESVYFFEEEEDSGSF